MTLHVFRPTETTGVADALNANFTEILALVSANEELIRDAVERLHGEGKSAGCSLSQGAGLWAELGDAGSENTFWVGGQRHTIDAGDIPLIVELPANQTRHIYVYVDDDGNVLFRLDAAKTIPSPSGEWYAGEATTNGETCTSVDDTDAENLEADSVFAAVQAIQAQILLLASAVGSAYMGGSPPASSLDDRVTAVESGGGVTAETVKWGALEKTFGDDTTVDQQIDEDVAAHVTAYHGSVVDGGDLQVDLLVERYDVDACNLGRSLLIVCRTLNPHIFEYLRDVAWVVWGVTGDGTDAYDFVDHVNSTWVPA